MSELAGVAKNAAAWRELVDTIAREFHETYERKAPDLGYQTRRESAVPWADVPHANKVLMRATVAELLSRRVIAAVGAPPGAAPALKPEPEPEPELHVATVPIMPELGHAIDLAKAAVERDRASLEPWVRQLVEALEPELERALEGIVLGVPSDRPPTLPPA